MGHRLELFILNNLDIVRIGFLLFMLDPLHLLTENSAIENARIANKSFIFSIISDYRLPIFAKLIFIRIHFLILIRFLLILKLL